MDIVSDIVHIEQRIGGLADVGAVRVEDLAMVAVLHERAEFLGVVHGEIGRSVVANQLALRVTTDVILVLVNGPAVLPDPAHVGVFLAKLKQVVFPLGGTPPFLSVSFSGKVLR